MSDATVMRAAVATALTMLAEALPTRSNPLALLDLYTRAMLVSPRVDPALLSDAVAVILAEDEHFPRAARLRGVALALDVRRRVAIISARPIDPDRGTRFCPQCGDEYAWRGHPPRLLCECQIAALERALTPGTPRAAGQLRAGDRQGSRLTRISAQFLPPGASDSPSTDGGANE